MHSLCTLISIYFFQKCPLFVVHWKRDKISRKMNRNDSSSMLRFVDMLYAHGQSLKRASLITNLSEQWQKCEWYIFLVGSAEAVVNSMYLNELAIGRSGYGRSGIGRSEFGRNVNVRSGSWTNWLLDEMGLDEVAVFPQGRTTSNPFPLIIHVAATSTTISYYCCRCRIPRDYPNTMVIGDATCLWYDGLNGSQLAKMKKYIPHMSLPWNV